MPIYTKKGDLGETGTFAGRMSKGDAVAEALGSLDELNSWIGVCRLQLSSLKLQNTMKQIQFNLFVIGTIVAGAKVHKFKGSETTKLERLIDKLEMGLPKIQNFIYPTNSFQIARTIVRRMERRIVAAGMEDKNILKYVNRLSDAMFVMGRWVAKSRGELEEIWKG